MSIYIFDLKPNDQALNWKVFVKWHFETGTWNFNFFFLFQNFLINCQVQMIINNSNFAIQKYISPGPHHCPIRWSLRRHGVYSCQIHHLDRSPHRAHQQLGHWSVCSSEKCLCHGWWPSYIWMAGQCELCHQGSPECYRHFYTYQCDYFTGFWYWGVGKLGKLNE